MADINDLMGGSSSAPAPKWNVVGDAHVGVITDEPTAPQVIDFKSKKKKWIVNTGGGKKGWELKLDGEFDNALPHSPVKQIKVPVQLKDGTRATFYFDGQKKDALIEALKATGRSDLPIGATIGVKLAATKPSSFGVDKKIYEVKVVH